MLNLSIQHVEIRVSSLEAAKDFYANKLGLQVIEEIPAISLLALKAGSVRLSIFGGFRKQAASMDDLTNTHVVFRTKNISETMIELQSRGLNFPEGIKEAPGFIRFISLQDPDGNLIEIGEYLREPV
ncbi:MAG: VOC family protein [Rhizobacter sp.]|nr:VOC family protein [Ferruginibacter sp.]